MSFFSGIVDENEQIRLGGYPAPFREMLGLVVEEYAPYTDSQSNRILTRDGKGFDCTFWSDVIHLQTAEPLASYEQDYYAGSPAVTHNKYGKGSAFYVGTVLDRGAMDWLVECLCEAADIHPAIATGPAGVEVLQRSTGKDSFLFLLNHSAEKVIVPLDRDGCDLLTAVNIRGSIELDPFGAAVIQMK